MTAIGNILVVCTGNVCRSPYIERRLRQLLAGTDAVVQSAGTRALVGSDIETGSSVLLLAAGAEVAGFASRQLVPAMLGGADIVVTATQQHRGDAVALHPRTLRKTFTLGELADLVRHVDFSAEARQAPASVPWAAVVAEVARGRRGLKAARRADESDIHDPFRRGPKAYERMAREIEAEIGVVAAALRARPDRRSMTP
ncbi:arsenate reductase/protein-tyrosine-phosphatase family protein [Terrabacter sp. AAH1]